MMHDIQFEKETHTYKVDGVITPSLTQILNACGLPNYSMVNKEILEDALMFGTAVHKTIELYELNKLDSIGLDKRLETMLEQWKLMKYNEFGINEPLTLSKKIQRCNIEQKQYNPIGYCCTPDLFFDMVGGNGILVEFKTGIDSIIAPMQTAAQSAAIFRCNGMAIEKRYCAHLILDSEYGKFEELTNKSDWNDFLSCFNVYNIKKRVGYIK